MVRIGVVLGAGGAVGQGFHAGVLAALCEVTGFDPRRSAVLVGTSAGSVTAASLRAGVSAGDLYARATGRPLSPEGLELISEYPEATANPPAARRSGRRLVSSPELLGRLVAAPSRIRTGLLLSAIMPEGRRDAAGWFVGFDHLFPGGSWPDEALYLCAVCLEDGRRFVFGRDELPSGEKATVAQAVQASCAIPGVYRPVTFGRRRYVDGGAHSPTNADLLSGHGLDAVIVSSPMSARQSAQAPIGERLSVLSRRPARRLAARELLELNTRQVPVLLIEPEGELLLEMGVNAMDFSKRAPVAERSRELAEHLLDAPAAREVGRILQRAAG